MIMMRPWLEDLVVIIHSLDCPKISWSRKGLGTRLRLEKIVKKSQEPLKEEIKGMRINMAALTMKITSMENGMQNVGKQSVKFSPVLIKRGEILAPCAHADGCNQPQEQVLP